MTSSFLLSISLFYKTSSPLMSTPHAPPPSQAGAAAAAGVHALPASKRSRLEEAGFAAVVRMELKKKQGEMVSPFSSHSTALSLLSPLFFLHSPALFSPRFFCVIEHCSCSSRREKRERAKAVDAIEEFRLLLARSLTLFSLSLSLSLSFSQPLPLPLPLPPLSSLFTVPPSKTTKKLADVGIVAWGRAAKGGYEVLSPEDLRQLPARLDAALSTPAARAAFVEGMEAALLLPSPGDEDGDGDDEESINGMGKGGHSRLMQALLPMASRGGGGNAGSPDDDDAPSAPPQQQLGDSFIRALLTSREAQADVAASLLAALPSLGDDGGNEDGGGGGVGGGGENGNENAENNNNQINYNNSSSSSSFSSSGIQLQRLVLAQFRWLEDVSDPVALTEALLGALCGGLAPQLRPDVLSFLPEVAPEAGYSALLDALENALASDAELLAPVLECADALDLPSGLKARVAALAAARLASAPPGALAAAASYVLRHGGGGGGGFNDDGEDAPCKAAVAAVRSALRFEAGAPDPRLPAIRGGAAVAVAAGNEGGGRRREALSLMPTTAMLRGTAPYLSSSSSGSNPSSSSSGPRVAAAVWRSLPLSPAASEAWLCALREARSAAAELTPLDLWVLIALRGSSNGSGNLNNNNSSTSSSSAAAVARRRAVDATLRSCLALPGGRRWLARSVRGHARELRPLFADALSAAAALASSEGGGRGGKKGRAASSSPSSSANSTSASYAADLYCALFDEFSDAASRSEVLRSLLAHLGSRCPQQVRAALRALRGAPPDALASHAAYVTSVLDHLESGFGEREAREVLDVCARVAVAAATRQARVALVSSGSGGGGSSSAAAAAAVPLLPSSSSLADTGGIGIGAAVAGGDAANDGGGGGFSSTTTDSGSRAADELTIALTKFAGSPKPRRRALAAAGTASLFAHLATAARRLREEDKGGVSSLLAAAVERDATALVRRALEGRADGSGDKGRRRRSSLGGASASAASVSAFAARGIAGLLLDELASVVRRAVEEKKEQQQIEEEAEEEIDAVGAGPSTSTAPLVSSSSFASCVFTPALDELLRTEAVLVAEAAAAIDLVEGKLATPDCEDIPLASSFPSANRAPRDASVLRCGVLLGLDGASAPAAVGLASAAAAGAAASSRSSWAFSSSLSLGGGGSGGGGNNSNNGSNGSNNSAACVSVGDGGHALDAAGERLAPALRLLSALSAAAAAATSATAMAASPSPLAAVAALLGAPLLLPSVAASAAADEEDQALASLRPAAKVVSARALLAAANWTRELLSVFGGNDRSGSGSGRSGGNENGDENENEASSVRAKLALRAQHACQLRSLLAAAVRFCPIGTPLPTPGGGEIVVVGVGGGGGGAVSSSSSSSRSSSKLHPDLASRLLRPLAPAAFDVLSVLAASAPLEAALAPAAALLSELAQGLSGNGGSGGGGGGGVSSSFGGVGWKKKRPSSSSSSAEDPTAHQAVPLCLLPDPDLLLRAAVDNAPAIGKLLLVAAAVLSRAAAQPRRRRRSSKSGVNGNGNGGMAPLAPSGSLNSDSSAAAALVESPCLLTGPEAAEAALDPVAAARGLALAALEVARSLLQRAVKGGNNSDDSSSSNKLSQSLLAAAALAALGSSPAAAASSSLESAALPSSAVSAAAVQLQELDLGDGATGPIGAAAAAAANAAAASTRPPPPSIPATVDSQDTLDAPDLNEEDENEEDGPCPADFGVCLSRVRALAALADLELALFVAPAPALASAAAAGRGSSSSNAPPPDGRGAAHAALRSAARRMLESSWQPAAAADAASSSIPSSSSSSATSMGGWKGRSAAAKELVACFLRGARDPCFAAASLARGALGAVPTSSASSSTGEVMSVAQRHSPGVEFPGLCPATLAMWYDAAFEGLQAAWKPAAASAAAAGVAAASAHSRSVAAAANANAAAAQPPTLSSLLPAHAAAHASTAASAAEAYSALMSLAKRHDREGALHAVALKGTAAFVASLLRSMPFWKGCVSACPVEGVAWFERVARLSQKGTRLAQAVIADGKARGDARLAAAAPSARKVMEALVVAATALVARAAGDAGASFGVGNLKHRDVQGRVVSSQQAYESSEEEESSSSEEEDSDSDSDSDSEGEAEVDEDKKKKASSSAAAAAAANKNKKKASKKARRDAPAPASAAAADDAGSGGEEEEEEEEETAEEDNGEEEEAEEEGDE